MLLWTIQHRDAYKKMMDTGTLQADGQHSPCLDDFRESYRWMAEQMIKRIGSAERYCISGMGMVSVGRETETPRYENAWERLWGERDTDYFAYHRCAGKTYFAFRF